MVGETLSAEREPDNVHDRNAVALYSDDLKVGHVPMKISSLCNSFLTRGGSIQAVVAGSRQFAADLPQGGLDVPCKYLSQVERG